jgi:hypothetical protein
MSGQNRSGPSFTDRTLKKPPFLALLLGFPGLVTTTVSPEVPRNRRESPEYGER